MAKSKRQSFRKNPIDDLSDMAKEQQSSSRQTEVLEGISSKLTELQAATELVAETVENTANRSVSSSKDDGDKVTLAQLLEQSKTSSSTALDATRTLTKRSNDISNKLSSIFKQLKSANGKLTNTNNMLSKVLKDITPDSPSPKKPAPEDKVVPAPKSPDSPSNTPPGKPRKNENKGDNAKRPVGRPPKTPDGVMDKLGKTLDKGFTSLISQGNTISKLLLDITITAALNAAKTVAIVTGIIFAIDVIRMKFEYYSKLLETNFAEFNDKAGKWAPILENILTGIDDIEKAFSDKDPMEVAKATANFIGRMLKAEIEVLALMLSKFTAAILRVFHANDAADYVEGMGLSQYQQETGAELKGNDKKLSAKYNLQVEKEKYADDRVSNNPHPSRMGATLAAQAPGAIPASADDPNRKDYFNSKNGNEVVGDRDNLKGAIQRTNDHLDDAHDSPTAVKSIATEIQRIKDDADSLKKESPDAYAEVIPSIDELLKRYNTLSASGNNNKVKPGDPKSSQVVQQERNIVNTVNNNKSSNTTQGVPNGGSVDVTNVKSVNNNHTYNVQTQTATQAPGMHRSMNVN